MSAEQGRFEMPTWPPPEHPIVSAARILADALDRQTLVLHSSLRDLADAGFDVARATNSAKASGRRG